GGAQLRDGVDVGGGGGPKMLAGGAAEVVAVRGGVESWAGAEPVDHVAGARLVDLHLPEARAVRDDVGGQVDAGDEPAVGADEEVGDAPGDLLQQRQAPPAGAGSPRPGAHVADAVADERHGG